MALCSNAPRGSWLSSPQSRPDPSLTSPFRGMEDMNEYSECPHCELVSRGPHTLSHEAGPCTWPSLAGVCPDCGRDGEQCTFFSRNKAPNACTGVTRLLVLSLCCEREGARIRTLRAMRNRVIFLELRGSGFCSQARRRIQQRRETRGGIFRAARHRLSQHPFLARPLGCYVARLAG